MNASNKVLLPNPTIQTRWVTYCRLEKDTSMPAPQASRQTATADPTRHARTVPRLPISAQRRDEDLARATRRRIPRQGRRALCFLQAPTVLAATAAAVPGARDASAVQEAANSQYRSITGEAGYETDGYAIWGSCAVAGMSDGRTPILTESDGTWHVVRHSTYMDGYDLDSVTSADSLQPNRRRSTSTQLPMISPR